VKYFGWRRAELAEWFKWCADVEQVELFPGWLTGGGRSGTLDSEVSVSALEAEAVDGK